MSATTVPLPDLWTDYDVAHWLGVSIRHVRRMTRRGEIPHRRLPNGDVVYERADLAEWYARLERRPAAEGGAA